jgi:pyridoxal phosphate-dependent aminotransferase EpsN
MKIYLSKPHMCGKEEDFVKDAFDSNFIAPLGPHLDAFEESVSSYLGKNLFCVGLSSGTAALHLALLVSGVKKGDEVWVSSMTFGGGVFPIRYIGAVPRFFDLNPDTWCVDVDIISEELKNAAKKNRLPKAIIPTDLYGQSVDLNRLEKISNQYEIPLVVDSAESLGAEYLDGRKAGSGGDIAILSFNGNKIITTSGGGMIVTKNKDWAEKARFLSTQARDKALHYQHSTIGYNYRLSNISAAIGLGQMSVLDERVDARRKIFSKYYSELNRDGIDFMPEPEGYKSSRWLTTLSLNLDVYEKSYHLDLINHLEKNGIESRPLWKPMHLQPVFKDIPYHGSGFDEKIFKSGICLPSCSNMKNEEQDEVIGLLSEML